MFADINTPEGRLTLDRAELANVPVLIGMGHTEAAQMRDFQNGTLQGEGAIAFTLHMYVDLPSEVAPTPFDTARYLDGLLTRIAGEHPGVTFEAEVGPTS